MNLARRYNTTLKCFCKYHIAVQSIHTASSCFYSRPTRHPFAPASTENLSSEASLLPSDLSHNTRILPSLTQHTYPHVIDVKRLPVFTKTKTSPLNKVTLHFGNIVHLKADAVVQATNPTFHLFGGCNGDAYSGAIMASAGPKLAAAAATLTSSEQQSSVRSMLSQSSSEHYRVTRGFNLAYKYVIHIKDTSLSISDLRDGYSHALNAAAERNIKSVVFPLLGAGGSILTTYDAVHVAVETVMQFLADTIKTPDAFRLERIVFCTNRDSHWKLYNDLLRLQIQAKPL